MSRTILITGTSSGIGESLANEFLGRGDRVIGISRRANSGLNVQDGFAFCQGDLCEFQSIEESLSPLLKQDQRLDLVILNAGMLGQIRDMADTPMSDLRQMMEVNVWANKPLLDWLFDRSSEVLQVVAISSGAAVNGNRGWNGYSISKAALNMMVALYAREREKTHFCSLAPGLVDTAMQDYLCGLESDPRFEAVDRIRAARDTEWMPTPAELAPRLVQVMEQLPANVPSGEFVDIRHIDFAAN